MIRRASCVAAVLALLLCGACATNPVTGRRELSLVSSDQEMQIGKEGFAAVVEEYGQYGDAGLSAYVDSVGQRVGRASHLPNLAWHFTVLDDPAVNAFAMPGGYIYITRGILAHLNSEAQLAGVLGHEIGHVTHRHTAEQMTHQQIMGLGYGVLEVAVPQLQRYSGAAQQALGLLFLKFSREHETEADELGVAYATGAGYDPREIPATYAMLKRVSQAAGSNIPPFLSTHPDPGDREARTGALAAKAAAGKSALAIRQRDYLRHLEGVVFGRDPREGYFEGDRYYQPTLGFQIDFPPAWKQQDSRAAVAAVEPSQQALVQLSIAQVGGAGPSEYVHSLVAAGKATQADGMGESIGGFESWIGRVTATGSSGPVVMDAAFIRVSRTTTYQVLGRSSVPGDADEGRIFASMRSFRSIADASRHSASPALVHLAPAPVAGSLRELIPRLGALGISGDELSIVNNLELDEPLQAGKTLKIVTAGKTH